MALIGLNMHLVNDLLRKILIRMRALNLPLLKLNPMTKNTILSFIFAVVASAASFAQTVNGPAIEVNKDIHDYGMVEYAGNGTCEFVITNTGDEPLVIQSAKASCGCTVPSFPKEPIAPGASATITVKYDTKRPGSINKSIKITSNAGEKVIYIKGQVQQQAQDPIQTGSTTAPANVTPTPASSGKG